MRIIGGTYKGRVIRVPQGLPVRPTTDFAKEGLFNILSNKIDFEEVNSLDLFSGTGHISFELASRGAKNLTCVDKNARCVNFIRQLSKDLSFNIHVIKADVFKFIASLKNSSFNLIFADPPYDLSNIGEIHDLVFDNKLLADGGILIIEHGAKTDLSAMEGFTQVRKYGNVNFSFFEKPLAQH